MIFETDHRPARSRLALPKQADEAYFYRPVTAMTPTTLWWEADYPLRRRARWTPPSEPLFPFRAPVAAALPTIYPYETAVPIVRARVRAIPSWLNEFGYIQQPPLPPPPPPPPPPPTITQTLYATVSSLYQPAFGGDSPFVAPDGRQLIVGDTRGMPILAKAGTGVALLVNLAPTMGAGILISFATVGLLESAGVDGNPKMRLFGAPSVVMAGGRQRQGLLQTLANLVGGGEYVAVIFVVRTDGSAHTYIAPIMVEG